jgi:hypothetical protein
MRGARPEELKHAANPMLTARLSESELAEWFPVAFEEITDPWATPEPSKGALIRLDSDEYIVIYWGYDSSELTVETPNAIPDKRVLASLLREVPQLKSRILWQRPHERPSDELSSPSRVFSIR